MYFYLANRPFDIYYGDVQLAQAWFAFFQEEGYHPVQISLEKAEALMAQGPDDHTQEVWTMRRKTEPLLYS